MQVPRKDIMQYAFVLRLLTDIAGEMLHPALEKAFIELWNDFNKKDQMLWKVNIDPDLLQFKEDC